MKYFIKNTVTWRDSSSTVNVFDINSTAEIKVLHVKSEARLERKLNPDNFEETVLVNGKECADNFTIPNNLLTSVQYIAKYRAPVTTSKK